MSLDADGLDGNGLKLGKNGQFFEFFPCVLGKSLKFACGVFSIRGITLFHF